MDVGFKATVDFTPAEDAAKDFEARLATTFDDRDVANLGSSIAGIARAMEQAGAKLTDFANRGDQLAQIGTHYDRLIAEVDRLAELSGDEATAERARLALLDEKAAKIARVQEAQERASLAAAAAAQREVEAQRAALLAQASAQQAASARLLDLASTGDEIAQLTNRYDRLIAEVDRLALVSGNVAAADRARIALQADLASKIANVRAQQEAATSAALKAAEAEQARAAAAAQDSPDSFGVTAPVTPENLQATLQKVMSDIERLNATPLDLAADGALEKLEAMEAKVTKLREAIAASEEAAGGQTDDTAAAASALDDLAGKLEGAKGKAAEMGGKMVNLGNLGQQAFFQISDAASQLSAGTPPLTVLIQQGGQLLPVLMEVKGLFAGLGAVAGPVGVAVVALGAAYAYFNHQLEEANQKLEEGRQRLQALQKAAEQYNEAQMDLDIQVQIANGTMKEWEAQAQQAERAYKQRAGAMLADSKARVDAVQAEIDAYKGGLSARMDGDEKAIQLNMAMSGTYRDLQAKLAEATSAHERQKEAIEEEASVAGDTVRKKGMETEARSQNSGAIRQESKDTALLIRLTDAHGDAIQRLQAMERGATAQQLDEAGQIRAALQEQLLQVEAVYDQDKKGLDELLAKKLIGQEQYLATVAELEVRRADASLALMLATDQKIAEADAERVRKATEAAEREAKAREAAAERAAGIVSGAVDWELSEVERLQRAKAEALRSYLVEAEAAALSEQQIAADRAAIITGYDQQIAQIRTQANLEQLGQFQGYISQGLGAMASGLDEGVTAATARAEALRQQLIAGEEFYTKSQEEQLKARADAANDAAQRQFALAKLSKIADAEMAGALAFSNALAQNPGPLGLVAAGLAFAAVQGQVAAIAAQELPTAHIGAFVNDLTPDEVVIKATREEAVLSATARRTLGDETIARAQAGQSPQNQRVVVVDRYRHQVFNRFIKDNLASLSPLSSAIGRIGHGMRD